jgi:hypothetical protein
MNPQPPTEPRWMSLADLMVVVAGCAIGYSLNPFIPGWTRPIDVYGTGSFEYASLFWTARGPLLILGFAIAAAIVLRRARYGGTPRRAEWPALVLAAALVSTAVLDHAYALRRTGPPGSSDWRPDHWPWAAAWSLSALAGLVLLVAFRRRIPCWVRALALASLATMWLCGPAHVYFKQATGAPPQTVGSTATWPFQLRWSGWLDCGRWPELLLFGVAIAAALSDRKRPGRCVWAWTEWAGLGIGLVLAMCWWLDRISLFDPTNPARLANVVVRALWLGGIGLFSWLLVRGWDAVFARLIEWADAPRSQWKRG